VLGLTVRHSTEGLSQVQALRCNTNWAPAFGRVTTSLFLGSGGGSHGRISPPRTSEDQFRCGMPVFRNDLRPGNLVFFISLSLSYTVCLSGVTVRGRGMRNLAFVATEHDCAIRAESADPFCSSRKTSVLRGGDKPVRFFRANFRRAAPKQRLVVTQMAAPSDEVG
jgi:hypothetical protein